MNDLAATFLGGDFTGLGPSSQHRCLFSDLSLDLQQFEEADALPISMGAAYRTVDPL
jgi:hypothetical protein